MSDELPDSPFGEPAGAEGAQPDAQAVEPTAGPMDRLFDGSAPGPSVGELEGDYGLGKPWSIFGRGCVRVATGDGIPPIVEIVIGAALGTRKLMDESADDGIDQPGFADPDADGEPPAEGL